MNVFSAKRACPIRDGRQKFSVVVKVALPIFEISVRGVRRDKAALF